LSQQGISESAWPGEREMYFCHSPSKDSYNRIGTFQFIIFVLTIKIILLQGSYASRVVIVSLVL
jgi:hypothetical protein